MGDNETWTIEALKEYCDALRQTDLDAVHLANANLTRRLEGFPQLYATKTEFEAIRNAIQKLERDVVNRDLYDERHKALEELVNKTDREKLSIQTFEAFVEGYKRDQNNLSIERRTNAVEAAKEKGEHQGQVATWGQIKALIAVSVGILSLMITGVNVYIKYH